MYKILDNIINKYVSDDLANKIFLVNADCGEYTIFKDLVDSYSLEGAERLLREGIFSSQEFVIWQKCKREWVDALNQAVEDELSHVYFPGCYGDPWVDC